MKLSKQLLAVIAGFCVLFSQTKAFSEEVSPPSTEKKNAKELLFNLHVEKATVAEVCSYLRNTFNKKNSFINIVVADEIADFVLPTMSIQDTSIEKFAEFIRSIGARSGDMENRYFGLEETGENIWHFWGSGGAVQNARNLPGVRGRSQKVETRVYRIEDPADVTLDLIEKVSASTSDGVSPSPEITFHEPSNSVIINAMPNAFYAIERAIEVVSNSHAKRKKSQKNANNTNEQRRVEKLNDLNKKNAQLVKRVAELEKLLKTNQSGQGDE